MKRRSGKALSFLTALTVVMSSLMGLGVNAQNEDGVVSLAAAPRVIYTYEGEEAEIFSGNMVDWAHSYEPNDSANPMFDQNRWSFEGENIVTLKRQRENGYNNNGKKAWITYAVDQLESFSVDFILGCEAGKNPVEDPTFQINSTDNFGTSPDKNTHNMDFVDVAVTKTGEAPTSGGDFARVTYTAKNIPAGVKYLRIMFPGLPSASGAGFLTSQLERVTINPQDTPQEQLDAMLAFENLSDEKPYAITKDLTLPQEGPAGQAITWSSSNSAVLSETGKVTRSAEDVSVTLTAKSTYDNGDGAKDYVKNYKLKILRDGIDGVIIDPCEDASVAYETSDNVSYTILKDAGGETAVICKDDNHIFGSEYLGYKMDGMSSFKIDVVENTRGGDKVPVIMTSSDGQNYYPFTDFTKTESIEYPGNPHGGWSHASYIAEALPDDTNYIRIYFGVQTGGKYWAFGFDNIEITAKKQSYAYQWPEGAAAELSNVSGTQATLRWPAVAGDNISYEIYRNDNLISNTEETSYTMTDLQPDTKYYFAIRAVNKENTAMYSPKLASDGLLTRRANPGEKLNLTPDETQTAISLPTIGGEIINAGGVLHIGENAGASTKNKIRIGFDDQNYVEIIGGQTMTFYKKGVITEMVYLRNRLNNVSVPFFTDDFVAGKDAVLTLTTEGFDAGVSVTWSDLVFYQVKDNGLWYESADEIDVNSTPHTIKLETPLPKSMTVETDVWIAQGSTSDVTMALTSSGQGAERIAAINLTGRTNAATYNNAQTFYETGSKTDKHYSYLKYLYLPILKTDAWQNVKVYVDFENYYCQLYVNNVLAAEDMLFVNDTAPDLSELSFLPTAANTKTKIKNVKVSSGYSGLFFNPVTVVDGDGKDMCLLKPGETATIRLKALNATDSDHEFVMITQQNDSYAAPAASEKPFTLTNDGTWQTFDKEMTAQGINDNIKAFIWDSADGMRPLTKAGGYIGTPQNQDDKANIFLIGDSTVFYTNNDRVGWGEVMGEALKSNATLYNLARDGISSKTYLQSGRLNVINSKVQEGDFIFFQLAHNDRNPSSNPDKGTTIPEYKENLRKYVAFAKSRGANFIFVTPATLRGDVENAIKNGNSVEAAVNASSLKPYAVAMEEVAAELQVPIIDLWRTSTREFAALGADVTKNEIFWENDGTHFTEKGAKALLQMIKDLLKEQNLEPISYFK